MHNRSRESNPYHLGQFYVFYGYGPSTNVYRLTKSGVLLLYLQHTNLTIVGAGVSTCAPDGPG